jgi:hypothetical protein
MNKLSIKSIDTKTHEGRLLFAALIILTTGVHNDKTPDQVIDRLYEVAQNTDEVNKLDQFTGIGNVYHQIDQLANVLMKRHAHEIEDGGAVEVAVKVLSRPNQTQAVLGFITHLCLNVHGITVGKGFNPANTMPELERYCKLNGFPDPHKFNSIEDIIFPPAT